MADLLMLNDAQTRRIEKYFPLSHRIPRVDDRRVLSGILFVIRNGLRWRDAPKDYGPHKTIYNRFIRWSRLGVPPAASHRKHVCQTQGLAAYPHTLRPMCRRLPRRHHVRSYLHLLDQ